MSRSSDTDPTTNPIDAQTIANYRQAIEDAAQELPTANARALRSGTERVLSALARYDAERAAMREIVRRLAAMDGMICTCLDGHENCPVRQARNILRN